MNKSFHALLLITTISATACTPIYKQNGFESEQEYSFSKEYNLSPYGVKSFMTYGINNAASVEAAKEQMIKDGYGNSAKIDDILAYLSDKRSGEMKGLSALEFKKFKINEALKKQRQDELDAKEKQLQNELEAKKLRESIEKNRPKFATKNNPLRWVFGVKYIPSSSYCKPSVDTVCMTNDESITACNSANGFTTRVTNIMSAFEGDFGKASDKTYNFQIEYQICYINKLEKGIYRGTSHVENIKFKIGEYMLIDGEIIATDVTY